MLCRITGESPAESCFPPPGVPAFCPMIQKKKILSYVEREFILWLTLLPQYRIEGLSKGDPSGVEGRFQRGQEGGGEHLLAHHTLLLQESFWKSRIERWVPSRLIYLYLVLE